MHSLELEDMLIILYVYLLNSSHIVVFLYLIKICSFTGPLLLSVVPVVEKGGGKRH